MAASKIKIRIKITTARMLRGHAVAATKKRRKRRKEHRPITTTLI
jgi:hypothetical protein